MFQHELLYRGEDAAKLARLRPRIYGSGALGANLAMDLCRMGVRAIDVVDRDRVEEQNLGTQPWTTRNVGSKKALALQGLLMDIVPQHEQSRIQAFDKDIVQQRIPRAIELETGTEQTPIVIDCLDNAEARNKVIELHRGNYPILHCGMGNELFEVTWDQCYNVPADPQNAPDVCEYPLSLTLVRFCVAAAAEVIARFATRGVQENVQFTLKDMKASIVK